MSAPHQNVSAPHQKAKRISPSRRPSPHSTQVATEPETQQPLAPLSKTKRPSTPRQTAPVDTTTTTTADQDRARKLKVARIQQVLTGQRAARGTGVTDDTLGLLESALKLNATGGLPDRVLDSAASLADLIDTTGSDQVPLHVALQPIAKHGLVLDGVLVDHFDETQLRGFTKLVPEVGAAATTVLQYLMADGGFKLTTQQLATAIRQIGMRYAMGKADSADKVDDPRYVDIATQMIADDGARDALAETLGNPSGNNQKGTTAAQARALNGLLTTFPNFVARLKKDVSQIKFGSNDAKRWGGGVFKDGIIEIAPLDWTPPEAFARLVVHEAGHATFQKALLQDAALPDLVDTGEIATLLARKTAVVNATSQALANQPPPPTDASRPRGGQPLLIPTGELATINTKLNQDGAGDMFAAMSDDAKTFYQAWLELRKDGGKFLLGLDLGPALDPAQRRTYQSGKFKEFCAETFMQVASGDLGNHLDVIRTRPDVPQEVKNAWESARQILVKYAARILAGH